MKKILSLLIVAAMSAGMMNLPVWAAEQVNVESYEVDDDGTTYINGAATDSLKASVDFSTTPQIVDRDYATGGKISQIGYSGTASYNLKVPAGRYEVLVRIPLKIDEHLNVPESNTAEITHSGKTEKVRYSNCKSTTYWAAGDYVSVGVYDFSGAEGEKIKISQLRNYDGTQAAGFDSVKLVKAVNRTETAKELELDEEGKSYVDGAKVDGGFVTYQITDDGTVCAGGTAAYTDRTGWYLSKYNGTLITNAAKDFGITYYPQLTAGLYDVYMNNSTANNSGKTISFAGSDGANTSFTFGSVVAGVSVKVGSVRFTGEYGNDFVKISTAQSGVAFDAVKFVKQVDFSNIVSYEVDHDGDKISTYVNGDVIDDANWKGSVEITNTSDWWGRTMVSCATATGGTYYSIANSGGTYGANYTVKVPQGKYEVFVRLPILTKNGSDWDKATIVHNGKSDALRYTPYKSAKYWSDGDYLSLGAYDFAGTGTEQVRLEKYRPDGSVDFDSVKLVRVAEQTEVITELELDEQGKAYVDGTAVNNGYVTYESAGRIGDGTSGAAQVLDDSDVWTVPAYGGTLQTRTSDVLGVTYFPKLTAGTYDVYMHNYCYTENDRPMTYTASDNTTGEINFKGLEAAKLPGGYIKINTVKFDGIYGKDYIKFTANSSYATFDTVKFVKTYEKRNDYYIAANGSDENDGSAESPLATVAEAVKRIESHCSDMTADITVHIGEGVYYIADTINITKSATNGHKIILEGAANGKSILSGAKTVTDWELYYNAQNIYRAKVNGAYSRQMYVNGARKPRAAANKDQLLKVAGVNGNNYVTSSSGVYFKDYANLNDIEFVWDNIVTQTRYTVRGVSGNTITFSDTFKNFGPYRNTAMPSSLTAIENAYEFIDEPGEWYINKADDYVYYKAAQGEDLNEERIILGDTQTLISLNGKSGRVSGYEFKNLTFEGTGWTGINEEEYDYCFPNGHTGFSAPTVDYDTSSKWYNRSVPAAVELDNAENIVFENNKFKNMGTMGVWIKGGASGVEIENNEFSNISHNALLIGVITGDKEKIDGIEVRNNTIHDAGVEYVGSAGICAVGGSNVTIANNTLYNIPYDAISFGWGWLNHWTAENLNDASQNYNNKILRNYIYDVVYEGKDGGAIYTMGLQHNMQIRGNVVKNVKSNIGAAYYFDDGSVNITASNNSALNARIMLYAKGCNNVITNNYFDNNYLNTDVVDQKKGSSQISYIPSGYNAAENRIENYIITEIPEKIQEFAGVYTGSKNVQLITKNDSGLVSGMLENIGTDTLGESSIYMAAYNGGELVGIEKIDNGSLARDEAVIFKTIGTFENYTDLKVFVWTTKGMLPLTDAAQVK